MGDAYTFSDVFALFVSLDVSDRVSKKDV